MPKAHVLGHLELMWLVSYDQPSAVLGTPEVVEMAAEWGGIPGELAHALVACGFLDDTPDGLVVHDLLDHAPQYVRRRHERREAPAPPPPAPPPVDPKVKRREERASRAEPPVAVYPDFPVKAGAHTEAGLWRASPGDIQSWGITYPALDIEAEMRAAWQWVKDNLRRRKTADGMTKFLGGWLGRSERQRTRTQEIIRARADERKRSGPPARPSLAERMYPEGLG